MIKELFLKYFGEKIVNQGVTSLFKYFSLSCKIPKNVQTYFKNLAV